MNWPKLKRIPYMVLVHLLLVLAPITLSGATTYEQHLSVEEVRQIQTDLRILGYDPGPTDGIAGPRTSTVIRKYQRDAGLYEDGRLTRELAARLEREVIPAVTASSNDEELVFIIVLLGAGVLAGYLMLARSDSRSKHQAVVTANMLPTQPELPLGLPGKTREAGPEKTGADDAAPGLPLAWFRFYTYIRLPLNIVLWTAALLNLPYLDPVLLAGVVFMVTLFVGLHRRRLWGWQLNWVALALECLAMPTMTPQFVYDPAGAMIIGVPLMLLVWFWPNYVYFKKRRILFSQ